jgi:hypothetical protein
MDTLEAPTDIPQDNPVEPLLKHIQDDSVIETVGEFREWVGREIGYVHETFVKSISFHQQRDWTRLQLCAEAAVLLDEIAQTKINGLNSSIWEQFDLYCIEHKAKGALREAQLIDLITRRRDNEGADDHYWHVSDDRRAMYAAAAMWFLKIGKVPAAGSGYAKNLDNLIKKAIELGGIKGVADAYRTAKFGAEVIEKVTQLKTKKPQDREVEDNAEVEIGNPKPTQDLDIVDRIKTRTTKPEDKFSVENIEPKSGDLRIHKEDREYNPWEVQEWAMDHMGDYIWSHVADFPTNNEALKHLELELQHREEDDESTDDDRTTETEIDPTTAWGDEQLAGIKPMVEYSGYAEDFCDGYGADKFVVSVTRMSADGLTRTWILPHCDDALIRDLITEITDEG